MGIRESRGVREFSIVVSLSSFCSSKHGRILGGELQDHLSQPRHHRQPEDLSVL